MESFYEIRGRKEPKVALGITKEHERRVEHGCSRSVLMLQCSETVRCSPACSVYQWGNILIHHPKDTNKNLNSDALRDNLITRSIAHVEERGALMI